jgi:hypothetical protein
MLLIATFVMAKKELTDYYVVMNLIILATNSAG